MAHVRSVRPSDNEQLTQLLGRAVRKYFPGYGFFLVGAVPAFVLTAQGRVSSLDRSRFVVDVQYDDGDSEEMYLEQLKEFIISDQEYHRFKLEIRDEKSQFEDTTWPPPSVSVRHIVTGRKSRSFSPPLAPSLTYSARSRAPSMALLQSLMADTPSAKRAARPAPTKPAKAKKQDLGSSPSSKPVVSKLAAIPAAKLPSKASVKAPEKPPNPTAKKPAARPATPPPPTVPTCETTDELVVVPIIQLQSPQAHRPRPAATPPRAWRLCPDCHVRHWSNVACHLVDEGPISPSKSLEKRWSGRTTSQMVTMLKEKVAMRAGGELQAAYEFQSKRETNYYDREIIACTCTDEESLLSACYDSVKKMVSSLYFE
jgi:hypothetical protein